MMVYELIIVIVIVPVDCTLYYQKDNMCLLSVSCINVFLHDYGPHRTENQLTF